MLTPDNRRLYSSIFSAPVGYVFDCGVGTTFSLDLEMLLFVPFCIAHDGSHDPERGAQDPVALLEAIHRIAERVTVFHQDGETNAPTPPSALYGLLENSLVAARAPQNGIFHPKCWVLRFISETDAASLLRVVVLSRNLTKSRSWDTLVCLHGTPNPKQSVRSSAGLADLLDSLPTLTRGIGSKEREALVNLLANEVRRTEFQSPAPFEKIAWFQTIGIERGSGFKPSEPGEAALAVSPFVSSATLRELATLAPAGKRHLISRIEEMAKCDPETLKLWACMSVNDAANPDAESGDAETFSNTADAAPQGLHAKLLITDRLGGKAKRSEWWLGSGNLTDAVRAGSNVELMVKLEGSTPKVGVEAFRSSFLPLLDEYQYQPTPPDPQAGARSLVEKTKHALIAGDLRLECTASGAVWDLALIGAPRIPDGVRVTCRPASLKDAHYQPLKLNDAALVFPKLPPQSLTAFMVFHVQAGTGESGFDLTFTTKLPILGLPAERDKLIARQILQDRAAFLRYLECVLGDLPPLPGGLTEQRVGPQIGAGSATRSSFLSAGLLENLVRALHRDPARLRGIQKLIEHTSSEKADSELETAIPDEFVQLWQAFQKHLQIPEEGNS